MTDQNNDSRKVIDVWQNRLKRIDANIERQIQGTRLNIENTVETIKINLIYTGLMLTVLSFVIRGEGPFIEIHSIAIFLFAIGFVSILASIVYSVKIQLGRVVRYPPIHVGSGTPLEYYEGSVQQSLEVAQSNYELIGNRLADYRRALSGQILGMSFTVIGFMFMIYSPSILAQVTISLLAALILGYFTSNIVKGEYDEFGEWG